MLRSPLVNICAMKSSFNQPTFETLACETNRRLSRVFGAWRAACPVSCPASLQAAATRWRVAGDFWRLLRLHACTAVWRARVQQRREEARRCEEERRAQEQLQLRELRVREQPRAHVCRLESYTQPSLGRRHLGAA